MRKPGRKPLPAAAALVLLACCGTVDFTSPMEGSYVSAGTPVKNFEVIGAVSVFSTETHSAGPLGFVKKVGGSKIGYTDLMVQAAALGADDIIDVRIDVNTGGRKSFADWLAGWERVFSYSGTALAVKYSGKSGIAGETAEPKPEPEEETEEPDLF